MAQKIGETRRLGSEWYKDEKFWRLYAPYIFGSDRWTQTGDEVEGIISLLDLSGKSRILDACCGVGRHSIELAKRGFEVTGIDLNGEYLDAAATTAASENIPVNFVRRDILELDITDLFDAVINMYTSIGYFDSREKELRFLSNLRRALKPGGRLLVETLGKEPLARDFRENEWYEQDGAFVLARYRVVDDWSRLENRWIILSGDNRYDYTFSHRIFSAVEAKDLFLAAGFTDIGIFGNLAGGPYDQKAEKLVLVGTK